MTTTKNFLSKVKTDGELKPLPCVLNSIKEAHRINPPVPLSAFMTNNEPIKLKVGKGQSFSKNTTFCFNLLAMNRDMEFWDNSEEFDLRRFKKEQKEFNYAPFFYGDVTNKGQKFTEYATTIMLVSLIYAL